MFNRFSELVKEAFNDDPRFLTARDKAYKNVVNDTTIFRLELPAKNKGYVLLYGIFSLLTSSLVIPVYSKYKYDIKCDPCFIPVLEQEPNLSQNVPSYLLTTVICYSGRHP